MIKVIKELRYPEEETMDLSEYQSFIDSLDFTEVNRVLGNMIQQRTDFRITSVRSVRGQVIFEGEDSNEYSERCGVMSCVFKEVKIRTFSTELSRDTITGNIRLAMTLDFAFSLKEGGSNGAQLLTCWYNNGKWSFRRIDGRLG